METTFWNKPFGKLIRWLAFIPVGFALGGFLEALPPLGVELARAYQPEVNFLTIIMAIVVVAISPWIGPLWFAAVYGTPLLSCRVIAPNHRVGSIVFGTLFCVFKGTFILGLFGRTSWVFILYHLVFTTIFIFGIVGAHNENA